MRQSVRLAPSLQGERRKGRSGCTIAVSSYSADAGHGSRTFTASESWRKALLGTAAAGALLFGYGRRAYANCAGPAPTLTCTGDITGTVPPGVVNGGIDVPGAYTVLDVNNLNADITPNSGTSGINFDTSGDISINSNTGVYSIRAKGAGSGIRAYSTGGTITVDSTGDVTATDNGFGIVARGYGAGKDVKVYSHGAVTASQYSIYAYANGGSVTVKSTGDVTATGHAVYAKGSGNTITLYSGTVYGMVDGVRTSGGSTLNNSASLSGGTNAVFAGGNTTINNDGTITGNVNYGGSGTITFNNRAGGIFRSGDTVNLGAGTLTNSGDLSPGGAGTVQTSALTGNLTQTPTGTLSVDLDPLGSTTADFIVASGSASLNGAVVTHSLSLPTGPQTYTIVVAGSPVTDLGATLLSSPALHATLLFNASLVQIATDVNFSSVSGLNANQQAIATSLNQAFAAGGGGLSPLLLGLLNITDLDAYKAALDQLSPEVMSDAQISALYASLGFANNLLSCRVNGTTTSSIIHEGQCLWAGASASFLDQGTTFSQIGFNQTTGLFAGGAQVAIAPEWRFGFGASYQQSWLKTATNATSDGQTAQGGVALKYNPGPFLLAAVFNGGRGWYDSKRPIAFGGFTGTATSDSNIDIYNGGLRAAYVFGSPHFYWKPMLDAAATRLDLGGFTETGSAANLSVQGSNQTVYTIAPSLEIGSEWWMANGTLVRPFLRGGATWYENGNLPLSASFLGAPAGVSPFTITTKLDDVMGTVGAGLDLVTGEDAALHLTYDGQFGDTTQISAVALKGSARF